MTKIIFINIKGRKEYLMEKPMYFFKFKLLNRDGRLEVYTPPIKMTVNEAECKRLDMLANVSFIKDLQIEWVDNS